MIGMFYNCPAMSNTNKAKIINKWVDILNTNPNRLPLTAFGNLASNRTESYFSINAQIFTDGPTVSPTNGNYRQIRSKLLPNSLCLELGPASYGTNGAATLQTCDMSKDTQLFTYTSNNALKVKSSTADNCVNVWGSGTSNNTEIASYACTNGGQSNDQWNIIPINGNSVKFQTKINNSSLLNAIGYTNAQTPGYVGQNVKLYSDSGRQQLNELWEFIN
jgi:hypothetical protein